MSGCAEKTVFIEKATTGKKFKLQLPSISTIQNILEKAREKLKYDEDIELIVEHNGVQLEKVDSIESFEEKSLFIIKESGSSKTFIVKNQEGKAIKISISGINDVFELEEVAREKFGIDDDSGVFIKDKTGKKLDSANSVSNIPDNSTLTIIEKLEDSVFFEDEDSSKKAPKEIEKEKTKKSQKKGKALSIRKKNHVDIGDSKESTQEEKELLVLKKKLYHIYENILPEGVTLDILNYHANRFSTYEREEYSSEKDLLERRKQSSTETRLLGVYAEGPTASYGGISLNVGSGANHEESTKENNTASKSTKSKEAVVSTVCYHYVKTFSTKLTLDQYCIETAKKMIMGSNPLERNDALQKMIKLVKNQEMVPILSFFCGGSFTIDAKASSTESTDFSMLVKEASKKTDVYANTSVEGWGQNIGGGANYGHQEANMYEEENRNNENNISVFFKHQSMPDTCNNVIEVSTKLNNGVENWTLFPDFSKLKTCQVDIIEMMKEQNDKHLKNAAHFIEDYMKNHNHFYFIGPRSTVKKVQGHRKGR